MSQPYLQGPALVMACSSGQGAIVVVEGETFQEDRWFYSQWFDDRAREVSFFPQNGWTKVVSAVADLLQQLPAHRQVFGIVDRDFAPDAVIALQEQQKPVDHVFRTTCFTVENYLLSPVGWLKVVQTLTRGSPPVGWQTDADVKAKIDAAYVRCVDLAAFNYTVRREYDRQPGGGIEYKKHPLAVIAPENELLRWGASRGARALDQEYQRNKTMIQALPPASLPKWITGKAVLKVFLEDFAIKSVPHENLKSIYIDKHPSPPPDITAIVTRIIERGGQP
jgi:hypothetical protein